MPWRPPRYKPVGWRSQMEAKREADKARPSPAKRGYGTEWERLRKLLMPAGTRCRKRQDLATDLDHIVARENGGSDHPSNLQPLCKSHHSTKTNQENGGFGNPRR